MEPVVLYDLPPNPPVGWAELELLGHRRLVGHLSEEEIAGARFLRLDVPEVAGKPHEVHYYSTAAVYGIHPSTERAVVDELTPYTSCDHETADGPCTRKTGHEGEHEGTPF